MKAVIFDLDDTLIQSGIDFNKMKTKIIGYLQSVGVSAGVINNQMLNYEIMRIAEKELRLKGSSQQEITFIDARVQEIMNEIELESLDQAKLVYGVKSTLKTLKSLGIKIGIITNSCHEYAKSILEKFKLDKYIDVIVARDDVKKPKPDPEHANHLLKALEVSAKETLFVGDHWLDAECAGKSGVRFIFLDNKRAKSRKETMVLCCETIHSIRKIVDIARLNRSPTFIS